MIVALEAVYRILCGIVLVGRESRAATGTIRIDSPMKTALIEVDAACPSAEAIARAAAVIRGGGLVAFPTETVYGLGANGLDPVAVARIFAAKGRPAANPIILHVADRDSLANVAAEWPETAIKLAKRFWPGPLTLVVAKEVGVPDLVTAGGPTVGIRCPAHPVAQALLRAVGVPLAAPSANCSTELSPTRAEHVLRSLDGRIDLILDAGPCPGGIESTVLDVTTRPPRLLRPGPISVPLLEEAIGAVDESSRDRTESIARSPGRMARHYSPRTPLRLVGGPSIVESLLEASHAGKRVGSVLFHGLALVPGKSVHVSLPANPEQAASALYDTLHRLDGAGLDLILVEYPPEGPEWAAIRDRLIRAAALPWEPGEVP
jgi:L-threonylcarbamoyladenylate synthase